MKTALVFWTVNFVPVALLLAIFEIWLEEKHKEGMWGHTYFKTPFWEKKIKWQVPFLKYLSRYHLVMFLLILPVVFMGGMSVWSKVLHYPLINTDHTWYQNDFSDGTMFLAIWLGNSGLEDFLYFLIMSVTGWHEPHALRRVVIEKDHAWFKNWLPSIYGLNIPSHWVFCPVAAILLLIVRNLV